MSAKLLDSFYLEKNRCCVRGWHTPLFRILVLPVNCIYPLPMYSVHLPHCFIRANCPAMLIHHHHKSGAKVGEENMKKCLKKWFPKETSTFLEMFLSPPPNHNTEWSYIVLYCKLFAIICINDKQCLQPLPSSKLSANFSQLIFSILLWAMQQYSQEAKAEILNKVPQATQIVSDRRGVNALELEFPTLFISLDNSVRSGIQNV